MRLSELNTGEKGVIVKVLGHGGFRKRIVEMGFIKGKTVEVLLNAPLRDPIKYKVMGYEISLRRQEAEMIEIISEQEAKEQAVQPDYHEGLGENMHLGEDELKQLALGKRRTINVALVGNPNCGKTSLFNIASGSHEHVGNYSGVTVDAKEGYFDFQGYHFRIVDLPGTYSLSAYSPEEIYVRRHIINETPDIIINVVDSSNLERNLYLTTQLIDMNVRMVIALNMYDELEASGNTLDYVKLSQLFGVPMLPTVSRSGKGIEQLFHVIINIYEGGDFLDHKGRMRSEILSDLRSWHQEYVPDHDFGSHKEEVEQPRGFFRHILINHGPELERSIEEVKRVISVNENIRHKYSTRFLAIKLLENDEDLKKIVEELPNGKEILAVRDREEARIAEVVNEESEQAITDAKYGFIAGALRETYVDNHQDTSRTTQIIDSIVTHRVWGYPIFFLFLYLMFEGTFVLGDYPMQGIEWLVGELGDLICNNMSEGPLKDLLVDGIIGGVGGVIVFLPNILLLYFFISLMEDSGYMARAAFIMDKIMHKMGLHGKSFIPLIMGFGCNVPAIMASRTIENERDRRMTIMTTTFIPCGAKVPFIGMIAGALFGGSAWVSTSAYFIGMAAIIISGIMLKKTKMFSGDPAPFVMELPAYHWPTLGNVLRSMWERGWSFIKKAGTIILLSTIFVWFTTYFGWVDGTFQMLSEDQIDSSILAKIGNLIAWIFIPLGWGNWQATVASITGLVAKENIVGTLGILYGGGELTVYQNIAAAFTGITGYSFLVFNLLCAPCFAAIGAIKREMNNAKWTWFAIGYQCGFAYLIALMINQFGNAFTGSLNVIGLIAAIAVLAGMIYMLFKPYKEATKLSDKH